MRRIALCSTLLFAAVLLSSCHRRSSRAVPVAYDRLASIEIEVYDPDTNRVWENVQVRIVEVEHEWSGCLCENPVEDDWFFTGRDGTVFFSPTALGFFDLGFLEDGTGRAVMSPREDEDEAIVLIEVYSPGLGSVLWEFDLTWDQPKVYIEVPF